MMVRRGLTLVAGFVVVVSGAAAQTLSVDENAINGCYAATQTGASQGGCIGDAATQCQDLPGGSTTIGIGDCLAAETAVWDKILNAQYRTARDRMVEIGGEDLKIALRDAQRAWIAFRDADCALAYDRYARGSIRTVVYAGCMMDMTAQRAITLGHIATGMQ